MPLPQEIRPAFQDIQDTVVRSEEPWIELSPTSRTKVLWVSRDSSTWAVLHNRDTVLSVGDYIYEPSGVLHGVTTALEDTVFTLICDGPVLFFNDNSFTGYTNWETLAKLREDIGTPKAAE